MSPDVPAPLLALDIGGTKVAWGVLVPDGTSWTIRDRGSVPTAASRGGPALAADIVSLVTTVQVAHPELTGVTVASAGVVDPGSGNIVSATETIPGWGGIPLGRLIGAATGLTVSVLNDVHAHGAGEALLGAGVGLSTVLVVAVGTGIGGALVTDGTVATGAHHMAGHVGHVHHARATGMRCSCGRQGHIEAIASGSGLAAWYTERRASATTADRDESPVRDGVEVARRANQGDELARDVVEQSARALGEVLGSLANCMDPDVVVLTGSVAVPSTAWWDQVGAGFSQVAMDGISATPLVRGTLGPDAPLLGAAAHHVRGLRATPPTP